MTIDLDVNSRAYPQDQIYGASIFDRYYSRRDTIDLLGSVKGRLILDAGCGIGKCAADLYDDGAKVVGIDRDDRALEIARTLAGGAVDFQYADLNESLAFLGRSCFDAILCSLVLHYIEDWTTPLSEFAKLLKPGGQLVLSVQHPFADYVDAGSQHYFSREKWDGESQDSPFWRRSLTEIVGSIVDAGFVLLTIREPRPRRDGIVSETLELPKLLVISAILS